MKKTYPPAKARYITIQIRYAVLCRDNFKCVLCGRSPATHSFVELQLDHIVPFSGGGDNSPENLQTLCRECNLGKGSRVNPIEVL